MKTIELGKSENLEKLNLVIGKITGIPVKIDSDGKCWHKVDLEYYCPIANAEQCLEATPLCNIEHWHSNITGKYTFRAALSDPLKGYKRYDFIFGETELIARCLALVNSVYGDEVPEELFNA